MPRTPSAPGSAFRDNAAWTVADGALTDAIRRGQDTPGYTRDARRQRHLFEFRAPAGARATCTSRAATRSSSTARATGSSFALRFRAPRFDAGFNKLDNAFILDVRIGTDVRRNVIFEGPARARTGTAKTAADPSFIFVSAGAVRAAQRCATNRRISRSSRCPRPRAATTNEKDLSDLVALGKETFTQVGCEACHLVEPDSTAVSSGPNLFGLFRTEPRTREVVEGGEGHRFQVKASREYLHQLGAHAGRPARGRRERPDQGPGLSTRDAAVPEGRAQRSRRSTPSATTSPR